ncbi:type VII secretion protein EccE [Mycobacterium sp.]|uniref:type VII secretion protein EccE n=1 Tax=Mycobacterium sp. TaxID=1785 RepID=UPI001275721D|nr:type VII secretion protein EccE [Mycobacterium sp.]KAA8960964.1 MAG: type VII secretion protein EccE [Mycobacterium sp.]
MKAQRRFSVTLQWQRVTAVFLADVAVLALASHCPDAWQQHHAAWWAGVALATVITIAALVTSRGIPLASIPVVAIRNWYAHPQAIAAACTPPIDHRRRFGRDVVGIRAYRDRLVTVIAVDDATYSSGRHHQEAAPDTGLAIGAVIAALRQFDVRLDCIDIVSAATEHEHNTWLVLRMDPQHNIAAVAARDSLAATAAAATERLAHDLDGQQCRARPLTAAEIADMDAAVTAGLALDRIRTHWSYLRHPDGYVTSAWMSPRDITGDVLGALALPDTEATVATIRLAARRDGIDVAAFVRYHSAKRLPKSAVSRLNQLTGRQLAALRASLPAPEPGRPLPIPSRPLDEADDIVIRLGTAAATPAYSPSPAGTPL